MDLLSKNIMNDVTSCNFVLVNFLKQIKMGPGKYLFLA